MALSKIDVANMLTGATPVANGGTGLASGTSGQFLKFTGSTTLASAASAGKIGQVVGSNNIYAQPAHTGTSYTDLLSASGTTWEISITPSATSSKILFMCSLNIAKAGDNQQDSRGTIRYFEKIGSGSYTEFIQDYEVPGAYDYGGSGIWKAQIVSHQQLRSPNTTSAVTYKFDFRNNSGDKPLYFNRDNRESDCVLMEVLA